MEIEHIEGWIGRDVVDVDGEKVGKLEEVYLRGDTPAYAEIKPSRLGRTRLLASLTGATFSRDSVRLPIRSDDVHEERKAGATPDGDDVAAAAVVAGDPEPVPGELESSTARAERFAAAEEARQRAADLEAEARHRAELADRAAATADTSARDAESADDAARRAAKQAEEARAEAEAAERGAQAP